MISDKFDLFLRGYKGLRVLSAFIDLGYVGSIETIYVDSEVNVQHDYIRDIERLAIEHKLSIKGRDAIDPNRESHLSLAAGWRYLIRRKRLLVLHDSILPRYRGFNPLVSMLINGEHELGGTLLWAAAEADTGLIVAQRTFKIDYPIRIDRAMERIGDVYKELLQHLFESSSVKFDEGQVQNEDLASFSLWRDEDDYWIDWTKNADWIERFVDAVSYPYAGALSFLGPKKVRIVKVKAVPDMRIENRDVGKVFRLVEGRPVVVCGSGLIRIDEMLETSEDQNALPLSTLKSRFTGK